MNQEALIEEIENEAVDMVAVDGIDTVEAKKTLTARLKGAGVDPEANELWIHWEELWGGPG